MLYLHNVSINLGQLTKTLQEAKVKIINQSVCNKLYDYLITSQMLCAGNLNGGIDACQVKQKTKLCKENKIYKTTF